MYYERLYRFKSWKTISNVQSESEECSNQTPTLSDKLNRFIQESQGVDENWEEKKKNTFTKELSLFELNIERTTNVSKVNDAIKTVVPTSVEAERTFSAAGLFITKIRLI